MTSCPTWPKILARPLNGLPREQENEQIRVKGKVGKLTEPVEVLTFNIADISADNSTASIELAWENTSVKVDVKADFDKEVMAQIEKNIQNENPKYDIVISALGQATRVLGKRLWNKGIRTQYFDIGSTVDALAERHLRTWIKRHADKVEHYKEVWK